MESLGNQARIEGFMSQVDVNGRTIKVLLSGKSFNALIYSAADIDISAPLGSDIREKDVIETLRSWVPPELLKPDARSQGRCTCEGVTMVLIKRQDNVANPFVKFEVAKIIE